MSAAVAVAPRRAPPLRVRPATALAVAVLGFVVTAGLLVPLIGYDPVADVDPSRANVGPSVAHWLGTDHLGRDVFLRLLLATRSFVGPGLLACAVAALAGVPLGAASGWYGGPVAAAIRYVWSVVSSVPRFVLVLLVASIYGDATWRLAIVAGAAWAPVIGEAVHSRIEELRNAEYVLANRAYGLPAWRILWVHLVWAACRRRIARLSLSLFGYFLVLESTLSYIGGFGVQEPVPSWGNMLVFEWGRGGLLGVLAPMLALQVVVLATAWLGEAVGEEPS